MGYYGLIDIGNTGVKVRLYQNSNAVSSYNLGHNDHALYHFFNDQELDHILISSVVPSINEKIKAFGNKTVLFLNHDHFSSLKINVTPPTSVGIDRLVNAVAVKNLWGKNTIIVDIGTCVTFCQINSEGDYCGGVIMPGFEMVRKALFNGAEQLPLVSFPMNQPQFIGTSTESAISSGIFYGAIHMINGSLKQFKSEFKDHQIILTGGVPRPLLSHLEYDVFEPNLQFIGLEYLYQDIIYKN
jgi:type III pantothenate kinase